jgi:FlaA1/EpsC-like NDP-sugar epimerase
VRYGNIIGSTGSVIPKWVKAVERGEPIYLTGAEMRRFFMPVGDAVDLVLQAIEERRNIICDTMKAIDMVELAETIADGKVEIKYMPPRLGERSYEILRADYEGGEYSTKNAKLFTRSEIKAIIDNEIKRGNIKTI